MWHVVETGKGQNSVGIDRKYSPQMSRIVKKKMWNLAGEGLLIKRTILQMVQELYN